MYDNPLAFWRGLLVAVPIGLLLWALIIGLFIVGD